MPHVTPVLVAETGVLAAGVVTVDGAVTGFRTFAAAISNGDTVDVVLRDTTGNQASYPQSTWSSPTLTLGTLEAASGSIQDGSVTIWAAGSPVPAIPTLPNILNTLASEDKFAVWDESVDSYKYIDSEALYTYFLLLLLAESHVWQGIQTIDASLLVSEYTTLGLAAPNIQVKTLTGTTPASTNQATAVAHGLLDSDRILYVLPRINDNSLPDVKVGTPHEISGDDRYFGCYWDNTNVYVSLEQPAGRKLTNAAFLLTVLYSENPVP
jgi:hypothetical protein